MKKLEENNLINNFIDQGFEDMRPRQLLPKVYEELDQYTSLEEVVMNKNTLIGNPCRIKCHHRQPVDSYLDLELARLIYNKDHQNYP